MVGVFTAEAILDRLVNLPWLARAVVFLGCLGGAAFLLWRESVNPLRKRLDDDAVALLIEHGLPAFRTRFIASIQLARDERNRASSLVRALVGIWKPLRGAKVMACVLAGSFATLIGAVCWFGKLDIGFTWNDAWGGLPRVAFSFAAGLAVYRLFRLSSWRPGRLGLAPLAVLPALLWVRLDEIVYPLACVGLIFPAFVFAAAGAEPGQRLGRLFVWLGAASYPLYALHKPVGEIVGLGVRLVAPRLVQSAWVGAPYLVALFVGAILVERYYDRGARRAVVRGVDR